MKYDYQFKETGNIIEVSQGMNDSKFSELENPVTGKMEPVSRLVTGGSGTVFKGGGWTINFAKRGYKGKFEKKIRERGTEVNGPANKREQDQQFNKWIESGGLDGIKPSFNTGAQTTEQMLDKNYRPKF